MDDEKVTACCDGQILIAAFVQLTDSQGRGRGGKIEDFRLPPERSARRFEDQRLRSSRSVDPHHHVLPSVGLVDLARYEGRDRAWQRDALRRAETAAAVSAEERQGMA